MEILLIVFVATLCVFSQAGECYHCGSRKITHKSTFGTRALCASCHDAGKTMKKVTK